MNENSMNFEVSPSAPIIPPENMSPSAIAKAMVACVRCSISVFEKCQMEPVWTGIGLACSSTPKIRTKGAPGPVAWTTLMCGWRQLPSSRAAL